MGHTPPEFSPSDNPAANCESFLTRSLTFLFLPAFNFWLLLCPRILSFDWSMDALPLVESVLDSRNVISVAFYGFLACVGMYGLKRVMLDFHRTEMTRFDAGTQCVNGKSKPAFKLRKRIATSPKQHGHHVETNGKAQNGVSAITAQLNTEVSFYTASERNLVKTSLVSLGILIFAFIPASNLFFYVGFVVAERVLYIPSVGFSLLIAGGVDILWQKCHCRKLHVLAISLAAILVLFAARTVYRNWDWQNEETLYRSGISVNPAKAWANLGNVLGSQGRKAEAEVAYRKALSYRSNMADTHYNLGIVLADEKRHSEAITCYRNAIRFRPRLAVAHLNLGIVLDLVGKKREALKVRSVKDN